VHTGLLLLALAVGTGFSTTVTVPVFTLPAQLSLTWQL
jgi:hypothetical protein